MRCVVVVVVVDVLEATSGDVVVGTTVGERGIDVLVTVAINVVSIELLEE